MKAAKRKTLILLAFLITKTLCFSFTTSKALCEQNGNILYNSLNNVYPINAFTKLMTTLVLLEKMALEKITLDSKVVVTKQNAAKLSKGLGVTLKKEFSVHELLKLLVDKLDDTAASELINYMFKKDEAALLYAMNRRAFQLNMSNTAYINTIGLAKSFKEINTTSAQDLAKLTNALLKNPRYMELFLEKFNRPKYKTVKVTKVIGKGKKAKKVTKEIKVKQEAEPFSTKESKIKIIAFANHPKYGYHMIAFSNVNKFQLIAVVLGAKNLNERNSSAINLLNYGYENFERVAIGKKGEFVTEVSITNSLNKVANLVLEDDLEITMAKQSDSIDPTKRVFLPKAVYAPMTKGERLGRLVIEKDGMLLGSQNLIVEDDVKKIGYFRRLLRFVTLNII